MENNYSFGYPETCDQCLEAQLRVAPYYREGPGKRVMLIGQDPTIRRKPERVKKALMLDVENGQLSRWLNDVFGKDVFQSFTLYATNLVKCSFDTPPSSSEKGGVKFLEGYFTKCKEYLLLEINQFKPDCVFTLGEPTHKYFIKMLQKQEDIPIDMKDSFGRGFYKIELNGFSFDYSPCLHIQTYHVAETYGEKIQEFKAGIADYFKDSTVK